MKVLPARPFLAAKRWQAGLAAVQQLPVPFLILNLLFDHDTHHSCHLLLHSIITLCASQPARHRKEEPPPAGAAQ